MKIKLSFLIAALIALSATACSGTRGSIITFNHLKYPVSMSSHLETSSGRVKSVGRGLQVHDSFALKKRFWSVLWGIVRINSEADVSDDLNAIVENASATGIANFKISSVPCTMNFFWPLPWIFFYPTCAVVNLSGDVVK